ncbi:MAG: arginase [Rhodobacteraceae bacterium]|nr:arginase [Paracoccaceae bacterium]
MKQTPFTLIGAPVDTGMLQPGCCMGPDAYRVAGLADMLSALGHKVRDIGNISPRTAAPLPHPNPAIHHLGETVSWTKALAAAAPSDSFPIFMGGDHSLSLGSIRGIARQSPRPLFILWLDAHPDFHTPDTTGSGNLHGTPLAYLTGQPGFEAFPPSPALDPANICILGARSIDPAEQTALEAAKVNVVDMRAIDEHGIAPPLRAFLARVKAANGQLHISLDVDFLDPEIAPAVGTTVPGGASFREAHLVMEILHDSALATSLDLVELNPFLDIKGRTARLMVDLTASLMGRRIFDRPTRSF